jgi:hypothetical protein
MQRTGAMSTNDSVARARAPSRFVHVRRRHVSPLEHARCNALGARRAHAVGAPRAQPSPVCVAAVRASVRLARAQPSPVCAAAVRASVRLAHMHAHPYTSAMWKRLPPMRHTARPTTHTHSHAELHRTQGGARLGCFPWCNFAIFTQNGPCCNVAPAYAQRRHQKKVAGATRYRDGRQRPVSAECGDVEDARGERIKVGAHLQIVKWGDMQFVLCGVVWALLSARSSNRRT